jgi:EmrB/QacA subfamily drug resistance transporter
MTDVPGGRSSRRWIVFSISFASFMVTLDTYIVNISLPTIARSFGLGTDDVSWIVLSYVLCIASSLLLFGRLGDLIGLKRLFIGGFVLFTIGSLACGLSTGYTWLISSRVLQAFGGSVLYSLTPAMVPKYVDQGHRGAAYGITSTTAALGITLGTPIGGLLTGLLSWNWIFLINLPVGIIAIAIAMRVLPDDEPLRRTRIRGEFDLPGALLSAAASLAFIYALNQTSDLGWVHPVVLGSLALSIVLGALFIMRERRVKVPLLDLRLFRNAAFTWGNIAGAIAVGVLAGHNFLIPFFLEHVKLLATESAGFVILFYSVVYMAVSLMSGRMADKGNPRVLCIAAMTGTAISSFLFSITMSADGLWPVMLFFVMLGSSYALFFAPNNTLIVGSAAPGTQGIVSGVYRLITRLGMAIGVCVFEIIFSAARAGAPDTDIPVLLGAFRTVYIFAGVLFTAAALITIKARHSEAEADL